MKKEIKEIIAWLKHHDQLNDDTRRRKIKPGFKVLFHGPPGTGKKKAAQLIADESGLKLYHVDLSKLVSKYIGETEKNLSSLFEEAESKNWILFFDEADAL